MQVHCIDCCQLSHFTKLTKNYTFGSDFNNIEFYAVSVLYRKLFGTEKAVPPKKIYFCTEKAVLTTNSILLQYRLYRN